MSFFCTAYLKRIFFLISNIGKILIVHFVFIHTEWTVFEFDLVIPWSLWRWYLFIGIVWCCRFDDYPKSQMCCYNYVRINHLKHVKWSRKNWVIIYHLQCFSVFDIHTCDLFFFSNPVYHLSTCEIENHVKEIVHNAFTLPHEHWPCRLKTQNSFSFFINAYLFYIFLLVFE